MILGFTGTREGMTDEQRVACAALMERMDLTEFHHGGCDGADLQAAAIVETGCKLIVVHPGAPGKPVHVIWPDGSVTEGRKRT